MADPFDGDADVRSHLAVLGPAALAELRRIVEAPSIDRTEILRALLDAGRLVGRAGGVAARRERPEPTGIEEPVASSYPR